MTKRTPVPFSWPALILSALVVPAPIGLVFALGTLQPLFAFWLFTGCGFVVTLAILALVLLPALWLLSWVTPIKGWHATLLGGLIAIPVFVFWDYTEWGASGVDSGPPDTTYVQWMAKSWFTWEPFTILCFGLVSGAAYHYLATRKKGPATPNHPAEPLSPGRGGSS
jgi:hypothetical protein